MFFFSRFYVVSLILLLDLLLIEEVGPVAEGEEEEGGGEADPGQNIYLLGSKLVILQPSREFG